VGTGTGGGRGETSCLRVLLSAYIRTRSLVSNSLHLGAAGPPWREERPMFLLYLIALGLFRPGMRSVLVASGLLCLSSGVDGRTQQAAFFGMFAAKPAPVAAPTAAPPTFTPSGGPGLPQIYQGWFNKEILNQVSRLPTPMHAFTSRKGHGMTPLVRSAGHCGDAGRP
jgi:hypothetical protein